MKTTVQSQVVCTCIVWLAFSCVESHGSLKPYEIFFFDGPNMSFHSQNVEQDILKDEMSCSSLKIDQTCIILKSNVNSTIRFLYHSLECDKCSMLPLEVVHKGKSQKITLDFASFGTAWKVINDQTNGTITELQQTYFGENSFYTLYVNKSSGSDLIEDKEPEFVYTPILLALGIYILLAIFWILGKYLYRRGVFNNLFHRNSMDELAAAYSSSSTIDDKKQIQARTRLRSLDTVRGISIVVMIFVNYGGGSYSFFDHSLWNGLTVADLVFPWFIWMMGMSMALSIRSQLRKVVSRKKIFLKIVKRSMILFALGIMLNTYCTVIDLKLIRIPGVLQRFSISYFVVATVHLCFASADNMNESTSWSAYRDILPYWGEWIIMTALLLIHILITFLLPVPECPTGYLGPGGMHDNSQYFQCTGGAAGYIDRVVLGANHIYQKPTFSKVYHTTLPYDPEGILGFLTSIFLVFLGLQAGKILLTYKECKARVTRWLAWACVTGAIAALLCGCSKNDGWIPVNKNLWSVSFIMATGSLAFTLISLCYIVIDVKKWWTGAPFYFAGMNSIMLYIGHEMTHHMFPWSWKVYPTHMNELFVDLCGTTLWVITAIWMHHKEIFVTI